VNPLWGFSKMAAMDDEINDYQKIQAEIARRQLQTPLSLAPGGSAQVSLFFPPTPQMIQTIILAVEINGKAKELHLPLPAR
jgi:hypothetical protein